MHPASIESDGISKNAVNTAAPAISRFASFRQTSRDGAPRRQTLMKARKSIVADHVRGRFFHEARPVVGTTYFPASSASTAVVICLYNEVGPELSRTVDSLSESGVPLDCVVVADGLAKLSESMKRYLSQIFQLEPPVLHAESHLWGTSRQTFISDPVVIGKSGSTFAVLLKRYNHKKINTHEWFFRAQCPNSGCAYALTTDTGAVFREGSIRKMIEFLKQHKKVAAVTGRQRVMSEYNQRVCASAQHLERRGLTHTPHPHYRVSLFGSSIASGENACARLSHPLRY